MKTTVLNYPMTYTDTIEIQAPDLFDILGLRLPGRWLDIAWLLPANSNPFLVFAGDTYYSDAIIQIDGVFPDTSFDIVDAECVMRGVLPVERLDGNVFRCSVCLVVYHDTKECLDYSR